jgi:integrase
MNCRKCGAAIPEGAKFCPMCGKAAVNYGSTKKRGNGQGTVFKTPSGKYMAQVTLGYFTSEDGKRHRLTRSKTFDKKRDAVAALGELKNGPKTKKSPTFVELYKAWLPTHRAGAETINCYKAAYKHFAPVHCLRVADIDVDDLQECLDSCPAGKRTRQNMKALAGLMYKYGIPRHMIPDNLNLAPFLSVSGEGSAHRNALTDVELEKISKAVGTVPHADEIMVLIYTGFRPSEFLALKASDYDAAAETLTGGAKTDAGRGRIVTLSPKIKAVVARLGASDGPLIKDPSGNAWALKAWTESVFYPTLEAVGIENPMVTIAGGLQRHRITPHSCRHTFATLMKRAAGSDKDKQALIGHASAEMLRHYQDVDLSDLRAITDAI